MKYRILTILLAMTTAAYAVDSSVTGMTQLTAPATNDWFYTIDVSDTTDAAAGTGKKILASDMMTIWISDTAWSGSVWNGITTIAPSKNAVYDYFHLISSTDDGKVTQLNAAAAGFAYTNASGVIGGTRTIAEGFAIDVTNADGSGGNPTVIFDPTEFIIPITWGNGTNSTTTWTWDLSGTDPVLTISSGALNVTTGSLQVGGVDVATLSGSQVFTNKTLDASATGNVLKFKSYPQFTSPLRVDGTGCTIGTTSTTLGYGLGTFTNSAAASANWMEFRILVPNDWDTAVDPRIRIADLLAGADTNTRRYVVSVLSVASSASATGSPATSINVDIVDAAGASGDVDISSYTTLTGWGAACTPGQLMIIRIARDGSSGTDTSTVNSTVLTCELEYPASQ